MFCPNCGSEVPDGAAVCPSCGSATGVQDNNTAADIGNDATVTGGDNKTKFAIIGVAAVVVVIILAVFISSISGNYKTPVKKMVKLLNKKQESMMEYSELLNPPYSANYIKTYNSIMDKCDEYTDDYGKSKDYYEDVIDSFEEDYGDDYKITIKEIKNVDKVDKDDLKDYQEDIRDVYEDKDDIEDAVDYMKDELEGYEDAYDLSSKDSKKLLKAYEKSIKSSRKAKVSAGYEMTIEFKIKGEDGHATYKAKDVEVYKINGKWVLMNLSPSDLLYGFE